MISLTKNRQAVMAGALLATLALLLSLLVFVKAERPVLINVQPMPLDYTESTADYEKYVTPTDLEIFESLNEYATVNMETFNTSDSYESVDVMISHRCKDLILLSDNEAWSLISGGVFNSYPTGTYASNESKVKQIYADKMVLIKVLVWKWAYPSDKTNLEKTSYVLSLAVNEEVADLFVDAFTDIYNDPSRPVINVNDAGMGTWVLRGKNHNSNSTISGHALGTTIDINPSTGSFKVNGTWYGNGYGHKAMPKYMWDELPECQDKYNVLYQDCPIVQVFKSYGFVWGGDWKSGTDCMHFSFLGDGKNAREVGQSNYYKYN